MQMQWKILEPDPKTVQKLRSELNCHCVTAKVLANRRICSGEQARDFIHPSFEQLPRPLEMTDMQKAVDRICLALTRKEKILIIGDYDADGVTSTALLVTFLKESGADVRHHLPSRKIEGYGFHTQQVMQLGVSQKIGLIITADCGVAGHEAVQAANRFGIDVIITDHHNIEAQLPDALAVINPKRPNHPEVLKGLAGVGVAFYLIIGLRTALRDIGWWTNRKEPNLKKFCDLVAVGTIADLVPLNGVNRVLTKAGLDQINRSARIGIQVALTASGIRQKMITSDDIAFRLAPRINAAGRIAHPQTAFDLLMSTDKAKADQMAQTLNSLNSRRQIIEGRIFDQVIQRIERQPDLLERKTILMAGADWHEGVLGIVAAKIAARFYKPALILSTRNGTAKGSGRSIAQLDLFAALHQCRRLLEKYGGHRQAAGLTLRSEKITELRESFENVVSGLLPQDVQPEISIECELRLDDITAQLLDELESLEPYGQGNPSPVFMARNIRVTNARMLGAKHRKMSLCQADQQSPPISAIHFNVDQGAENVFFFEQMAFRLQWNRYKGTKQVQLVPEAF
ncbi:MAG: single-stranded-DNA-specific exonuclease RecJ [Desulfobacteraceae bacterium]|nr:single-stranded-DNA-specific exonuclease RecJ [Desulfobacteraceae bacterium]